jgi:ADP-heptose:LPS heptosyltransferase
LANTSSDESARELLGYCLRGEAWPADLARALAADPCSDALFRIVAEGLADRFEPGLCEVYAELFAQVIAEALPGLEAGELAARYRRVRQPRTVRGEPRRVFVLSRVTLGADIAVTSVVLDAAKRRFPGAEILLAGGRKNWELFAGDPRVGHLPAGYRRGTLRERLAGWPDLRAALSQPESIVIDPDSRLTQLGLLPVCAEENYYFFESRSYGGGGDEPLCVLAARWARETMGVDGARPYMAPACGPPPETGVAVSFGVGENPAKRIADPFEEELLRELAGGGAPVWIDKGAGGEEAARVERAAARAGTAVRCWEGSFAGFAAIIAASRLYVGYDSAGQHAAAACGVPLLSVFAGFPCPRLFSRWRPRGSGPMEVVRVEDAAPERVLEQARRALERIGIPCS